MVNTEQTGVVTTEESKSRSNSLSNNSSVSTKLDGNKSSTENIKTSFKLRGCAPVFNPNSNKIIKNTKKQRGLIILRGLPGSGKTTLANKLAVKSNNCKICTEDKYYWSGGKVGLGEYKFKPELVFSSRQWCSNEIKQSISSKIDLIIIDNHNCRISMYDDNIKYAISFGYKIRIIEFVGSKDLIDKYKNRSHKNFPKSVYLKLLDLWEEDLRSEVINPIFKDTNENICFDKPKEYEILIQARVRENKEFNSMHITDLPEGTNVMVTQIVNKRAKIIKPIHGWVSLESKFGTKILLPVKKYMFIAKFR